MLPFVRELQELRTVRGVGERWIREVKTLGVVRASYHLTPAFASQTDPRTVVVQFGFPEHAMNLYADPLIRAHDPIPDRVMQLAQPVTWKQALKGFRPNPDQRRFLETAVQCGVTEGYAVPLYGPNGRDSYSSFGLGRVIDVTDDRMLQSLIGIGQMAHVRICVLIREQFMAQAHLSKRELDVLQWLASAKSVQDIATILGLSPATIDTYVRRIYKKLKAGSRLTSVINGLRRGLIRI
jgi:DNA-binding CsgD family transcriptional regulator